MVEDTVRDILVGLGLPEADIQPSARLHGDLELDSTELVEVTLELKRRLDAEVKLETGADLTVGVLCRLVEGALARA